MQTNLKLCTIISITDLVRKCNVSTATVLRATQKLDFNGYSRFKFFLKNDTEGVNVSTLDMIEIISQDTSQTIKLFKQNKEINEICRIIDRSGSIYAYGAGHGQRLTLQESARCFLNINKNIILIPSLTELEIIKKPMKKTDLLFIASWSGSINKYRDTLTNLEVLGIPMISIICLNNSDLPAVPKYSLHFQSSTMDRDMNTSRSSYLMLHLILYLFYDGYIGYVTRKIQNGADIDKNYTKPTFYNTATLPSQRSFSVKAATLFVAYPNLQTQQCYFIGIAHASLSSSGRGYAIVEHIGKIFGFRRIFSSFPR